MTEAELFVPISMETWPRAQIFYYYTQMAPTSYTVDVRLDVTVLRKELKRKDLKFFPAYLWLVTRAIQGIQELRVGVRDGILGHWQQLTPAYPQFHENDKTTSLLWTEYHDRFPVFYENYMKDTKEYGDSHGILSAKGMPLPNSYVISCIPWFTFQSFSLHNHGMKDYYFPSFEAGKFVEAEGKILMPLSVTVHHATTDGYHLKELFEELQEGMNHPEQWMNEI
ncbi:chloramphenicol acetyltransferase [Anaerotignum neopropionicum]|uniref:Chloramphenicol acetyltransferase n=1 Tax=Anaerotignum neopropionicum TaxID=36847 RepID=A0A136WAY8_9FIRM|nr:CatA-like O-acetyltransferase [Anaerotignum neopropionicum]KXL51681.1 chloramphenicol acetyltransferase [Anaerotignum neopropionicum]